MSTTAIIIDSLAAACLIASLLASRQKTGWALRVALNATKRIGPLILGIIALIGLMVGFVPAKWIASTIGPDRGALGVIFAALLGAVLFIPGLIAFPLAKSLLDMGAGVMSIAAFVTTLMMVGVVFLPLEIKELGKRFTLIRNGLAFVAALSVAVCMGLIL